MDLYLKSRKTNLTFSTESMAEYLSQYSSKLNDCLKLLSKDSLEKFAKLLICSAEHNGQVLVIGNGGSAAISDHLCCDFAKGTLTQGHPKIRPVSLSSNSAMYSAAANDFGFEYVFSSQIEIFAQPNDILIAISSSGESQNIINGIEKAKSLGLKVVGLTGFDGGKVRQMSDISLHIDVNNYGIVEDAHQIIMHTAAQLIAARRRSAK